MPTSPKCQPNKNNKQIKDSQDFLYRNATTKSSVEIRFSIKSHFFKKHAKKNLDELKTLNNLDSYINIEVTTNLKPKP